MLAVDIEGWGFESSMSACSLYGSMFWFLAASSWLDLKGRLWSKSPQNMIEKTVGRYWVRQPYYINVRGVKCTLQAYIAVIKRISASNSQVDWAYRA